jgi:hypothetical protein
MFYVTGYGGREECWLLRYEADLCAEPLDVEFLELDAVQLDAASNGVTKGGRVLGKQGD